MARWAAQAEASPERRPPRRASFVPTAASGRERGPVSQGHRQFRWRFHGLFYPAPTELLHCRLRIANGILTHWQLAGVADLAQAHGGGYAHVTTRANLQIRDVMPHGAIPLIEGLAGLGIPTKGTGADNIRNVTGSPTAGIDPQELIDTRPYARAWHHHILNDRSLYGLPRKFNVGFDGGGAIPVLEDTNDIAFTAVRLNGGDGADAGVWFRLGIGGITGHQDFAKYGGVYVRPEEAMAVADAIVRVFIANGDRTDRKKARLKYVLDAWGLDKFLTEVEAKLGTKLVRRRRQGRRAQPGPPHTSASMPAAARQGRAGRAARRQVDGRAMRARGDRWASWATAISASPSGRTC
jgi:ferredoxin-nitrite reductase